MSLSLKYGLRANAEEFYEKGTKNMQFTVVTGMSGSGKTRVIRYLEDMGYFCIDNMPPALIPKFAEMINSANRKITNAALVIDTRVGDMINELIDQISTLRKNGFSVKVLYLNADDETLVKRYKETRRAHPINNPEGLLASIRQERKMLDKLLSEADYVIDTSGLSNNGLLNELREIYVSDEEYSMDIHIMAFGFKYGMPVDADLVFDVRCFPNPFYIEELKHKTGNDKEVQDYVMSFPTAQEFIKKLCDMMEFLVPLYDEEGKVSLTIAIGCTGGKHRSVTMVNLLADYLRELNYKVDINCRDIDK